MCNEFCEELNTRMRDKLLSNYLIAYIQILVVIPKIN